MVGVLVHIIIGLILFTPIGFIAGYIQDKKAREKEEELNKERLKGIPRNNQSL